ncbi:hypothetical protein [Enterococcus larvae]|uniref:hypothetical protein n=1 Tax=Enterococcus larvae TaxID=2794352 RepID=UPI003F339AAB
MIYVVKHSRYPYMDKNGNPTFDLEKAQVFSDKEMAELSAATCQGTLHQKIAVDKKFPKKQEKKVHAEKCEQKRLTNQAWMRGGS